MERPPMTIVVRPWAIADLPAVREVTWVTWLDAYSSFIPESDLRVYYDTYYTLTALAELFHTKSMNGLIAEADGAVAGYLKTNYNKDEKRFYVSSLYILPSFQGKGIGGRLMRASEEIARTFGADSVWLGVMTKNIPALDWYRNLGFTFVEEAPFTMGSTTVMHLIGSKKIIEAAKASHQKSE